MALSAYQKLKKENKELHRKLRQVCNNPESFESSMIIADYKFIKKLEDNLASAEANANNP
jgi:hypothetical protein